MAAYVLGNPRFLCQMLSQRKLDLARVAEFIEECEWQELLDADVENRQWQRADADSVVGSA